MQRSQRTTEELGDFGGPQRVVAFAIKTLKFPTTDILAEQKSHGLTALRTGRRCGIFEWRAAVQMLIDAAEDRGPMMFAKIGMQRAMERRAKRHMIPQPMGRIRKMI